MPISRAWIAVWRRNYLVWKKLAAESVLGNIIEPLFYLVGFGVGFGAMLPEVEGVKYIAYLAGGTICYSTMLAASFEALYSGFARMHVQRTWEGILNAPVSLEDVVFAEWVWAASKSFPVGHGGAAGRRRAGARAIVDHGLHPAARVPDRPHASRGLGLVMTAMAKSYDFFMYWFTLALTPMMLLSGVFYPIANMPGWLQAIANALPLTHAIAIGRPLLLGRWPEAPLLHVAVLAAYGVAGFTHRARDVPPSGSPPRAAASAVLDVQPYGVVVAVVTGLPAFISSSAATT